MPDDTPIHATPQPREPLCLAVDDEAHVRLLLLDALSHAGYRVVTACGGLEALNFARQIPLDIVLLDKRMPGLSGYETAAALRAIESVRRVPMILMTGFPTEDEAEQAAFWGFQDYIEKPFTIADLLQRMARWINRHGS